MQLSEPIGEGRYRECYGIDGSNLCAKRLKPLKLNIKSLVAHILRDINQEELDIFLNLPEDLKPYFPSKYQKKNELLITERPKDFDDSFSKPLIEYGGIDNLSFWKSVDSIANLMVRHKLWLFDVFHMGNNIVVQRISENTYKPIIIDCKRFGWSSYPLQVNLLLDSEKEKKFHRRLDKFKQIFKK